MPVPADDVLTPCVQALAAFLTAHCAGVGEVYFLSPLREQRPPNGPVAAGGAGPPVLILAPYTWDYDVAALRPGTWGDDGEVTDAYTVQVVFLFGPQDNAALGDLMYESAAYPNRLRRLIRQDSTLGHTVWKATVGQTGKAGDFVWGGTQYWAVQVPVIFYIAQDLTSG